MQRTIIGFVFVAAVFAGLGGVGWYFVKPMLRVKPEYRLSADKIVVSPPPEWVPEEFIEEVLQSSDLSNFSLLDKTLPQKLSEAFTAYPWVERAEQITLRYPSGADAKLVYREPIALVEVPKQGLFLVDRNGILLPTGYLRVAASEKRANYLVIQGINSMPLGSVGTPWGDPLVQTAAQLAAELRDVAEPLKLMGIIPATENTQSGMKIVCRLKTAGGTEIRWGYFVPDDPKNETKKKRLWNLGEQFRTLDNVPARFQPIDLSRE